MSIDSEAMVWFLMRAAYGQEQKVQEFLEAKGIETFLPLQEHCFVRDGKRVKKMQSLIPNFLFVKSTENEMKKYIGKQPVDFLHHYYVPHKDNSGNAIGTKGIKPLVIPDEQMAAFQQWYAIRDDNKLFIADDKMHFTKDQQVKVIGGKFEGMCGRVCHIKGQSRVGIVISGVGIIFTAYIPKGMLEVL